MCLVAIAVGQSTRFPWVLASNRDEFHDRPTVPMAWWLPEGDSTEVLGGRDLAAGGSWLALRADGRLALVTNVREPGRFEPAALSRGALVVEGLRAGPADRPWLQGVAETPRNGFNLLLADLHTDEAVWSTNRPAQQRVLGAGIYGVSNASLDTPWPKVNRLKRVLGALVDSADSAERLATDCLAALADRSRAPDEDLPQTGVPIRRERQLSSSFIHIPASETPPTSAYGTRCSTVVVVEMVAGKRWANVFERRFDAAGAFAGQTAHRFALRTHTLPDVQVSSASRGAGEEFTLDPTNF